MSQQPTRDPRQPFGRTTPAPVETPHYAPPPQRRPWWLIPAALALVALLAFAATRLAGPGSSQSAEPAPVETQTQPASVAPASQGAQSTSSAGTGLPNKVPFVNATDDSEGTFEILRHTWTGDGLLLTMRVSLSKGQQRLGFFAMDNGTQARQYDPVPTGQDYLDGQTLTAGQSLTGTVLFPMHPGDATIVLTGSSGKQVTALVVKS